MRRPPFWMYWLLIFATALPFAAVPSYQFVNWDDGLNVYQNPHYEPLTTESFVSFWKEPYFSSYIPVTRSVWSALVTVAHLPQPIATPSGKTSDLNAGVFHLFNVLMHMANVLLVFALLRLLVGRNGAALAGALFFGLHPLQVEPVAWITGLKDLLSGFFGLWALWLYLRHAQLADAAEGAKRAARFYHAASLCFVLALLSKSSMVTLPLAAWLLDRYALGRPARLVSLALAPWLILALPAVAIANFAESDKPPSGQLEVWTRPFIAGDALAFYMGKLLWPWNLVTEYGRTPQSVMNRSWGYFAWLLPAALGLFLWNKRRAAPILLASGGLCAALLLPVLGLTPFAFQTYSTVADRYFYVAMLGPALAVAWLLKERPVRHASWPLCAVVLILCAGKSALQSSVWHDTRTLFAHVLTVNPISWRAHHELGLAAALRNDDSEAIARFRETLRWRPHYPEGWMQLGQVLFRQKQLEEAVAAYQNALREQPNYPEAVVNLGAVQVAQGQIEEATWRWCEALALQPAMPEAERALETLLKDASLRVRTHIAMGIFFAGRDNLPQAETHWKEALRLDPKSLAANENLGRAAEKQNRAAEAATYYRAALQTDPNSQKANEGLARVQKLGG